MPNGCNSTSYRSASSCQKKKKSTTTKKQIRRKKNHTHGAHHSLPWIRCWWKYGGKPHFSTQKHNFIWINTAHNQQKHITSNLSAENKLKRHLANCVIFPQRHEKLFTHLEAQQQSNDMKQKGKANPSLDSHYSTQAQPLRWAEPIKAELTQFYSAVLLATSKTTRSLGQSNTTYEQITSSAGIALLTVSTNEPKLESNSPHR